MHGFEESAHTRHPRYVRISKKCGRGDIDEVDVVKPKKKKRKERRVDALALRAEERRDKLRKAAGSGKYTLIRRSLNGETRQVGPVSHSPIHKLWWGTR